MHSIVRYSIESADRSGEDVCAKTRDTLAGVVRGTRDNGDDVLEIISKTSHFAVWVASEIDADLAEVAEGAVRGAVGVAAEAGLEPRQAASAAAEGILRAASEIGEPAIDSVVPIIRDRLAGIVDLGTPMRDYVNEDGFQRGYN
jgi:hypothetical protein